MAGFLHGTPREQSPLWANDWPMNDLNQTRTFRNERHENTRKWWAREDSNLQPDRYERSVGRSALLLPPVARSMPFNDSRVVTFLVLAFKRSVRRFCQLRSHHRRQSVSYSHASTPAISTI